MARSARTMIPLIASLFFVASAFAQSAPRTPTPSPVGAKVEFIDLKDGAIIGPKTIIHFGLHGMGIAPAEIKKLNSGHHHLLIDTDLPPLDRPIPNDENHLHFGGGQTEIELSLPPGSHTLQLLLGDADHIPHWPPIYSNKVHVSVVDSAPASVSEATDSAPRPRHPSTPGARLYFISPKNGAYLPSTFSVRFGLEQMGVAPAGVDKANSGHHHIVIDAPMPRPDQPIPNNENHLHFGAGQTEATITLPKGRHTLQLFLGDAAHVPHQPPVYSERIVVYVGFRHRHKLRRNR
jgi:hypothetical protein